MYFISLHYTLEKMFMLQISEVTQHTQTTQISYEKLLQSYI